MSEKEYHAFDHVNINIDESQYFPYAIELIERTWSLLKRKKYSEICIGSRFMDFMIERTRVAYDHELALTCKTEEDAYEVEAAHELSEFFMLKMFFAEHFPGPVHARYLLPEFLFEREGLGWYKYELSALVALTLLSNAMACCDAANSDWSVWEGQINKLHEDNFLETPVSETEFTTWNKKQAWRFSLVALSVINFSERLRFDYVNELLKFRKQSNKAKNLNNFRHRETHEAREKVLLEWEKKISDFPSATKAGYYFYRWLLEQGLKEHEPLTITKWIRDRAKQMGIRLR